MDLECNEKTSDKTQDIGNVTDANSSGGFGEVEVSGSAREQNLTETLQESTNEDCHKKKEPITILSVEVMSSGTEFQSEEQTSTKQAAKDSEVEPAISNINSPTTLSQLPNEPSTINVVDTIEEASIINKASSETSNDLPDAEIFPNELSNPLEKNHFEDTFNENTTESTNLPILDVETNSLDTRAQQESIIDVAMNDTLLDVADIPNDLSPVAESTNILNDSAMSTACIIGLESVINDDTNTSLPLLNKNLETSTTTHSTTGLSLLAQYGSDNEDSDTDTESVIEVPTSSSHDYRSKVVEIDSDSDTVSSSSDSEVEYLKDLRKKIEKRMEVDDDDTEDENESANSENKRKPKTRVKVKGEMLLDDLPPIQDLQITVPEEECIELGKIHSIVDQLVLVSALPNSVLLDLETVLFLDKGKKVLGEVFDVLGQVADPIYCVRFNTHLQITEKNIKVNDVVYVAPKTQYTQFIILSKLMTIRGSDASWENDLEPPPKFIDYSDDEQEQLARRQMRNRNRPNDNDDPEKRPRVESEQPQSSSNSRPPQATQYRQHRYPHPRDGQGPNNQNSYGRPAPRNTYNNHPQYRNQQSPNNHHPSSWHSNYYPQPYGGPPPNYGYGGGYTPMPVQNYPSQGTMYPMPQMHTMPYPPPQHLRLPPPLNNAPGQPQLHPSAFSMIPPTMPGGHFESSTPPPGAQ